MCHTKTPPIQGGALRVLPGPLAVPHGDPGAGAKAKSKARREFRSVRRGSWDPLGPAVPVGQTPQGRRTRMCAVFGRGRRPRSKIPAGTAHPPLAAGGPPGGVSFAYFSLHKQRKVGPPRRAAPCLQARRTSRQAQKPEAAACLWSGPIPAQAMYFVAPLPNPSLPQGLPSVAAGRGASSWGR